MQLRSGLSKLYNPFLSDGHVFRPALIEFMENAGSHILLCAAAGYGKTSAMIEFSQHLIAQQNCKRIWLSLNEQHNDEIQFLQDLSHVIVSAGVRLPDSVQSMLQQSQFIDFSSLFEELVQCSLIESQLVVFCFDDFHLLTKSSIVRAVEHVLAGTPSTIRCLITTRHLPEMNIARLRMEQRLTVIEQQHLSFSKEEIRAYYQQRLGFVLSDEYCVQTYEKIDGWIAGLQLLTILIREFGDDVKTLKQFNGTHHFVRDYMMAEVFNSLSTDLKHLLLMTSIVERFNCTLAEFLCGLTEPQRLFEVLLQKQLFLIPLDTQHQWFRYHHLFQEFLQAQLALQGDTVIKQLHTKVSAWFIEQACYEDALLHALKAEEPETVCAILLKAGWDFFHHGKIWLLEQAYHYLDDQYLAQYCRVAMLFAWTAFVHTRRSDVFNHCLTIAETYFPTTLPENEWADMSLEVDCLKADATISQEPWQDVYVLTQRNLERLEPLDSAHRSSCLGVLARLYLEKGRLVEAADAIMQAVRLAKRDRVHGAEFWFSHVAARIAYFEGCLTKSKVLHQNLLNAMKQYSSNVFSGFDYFLRVQADIAYLQHDLQQLLQSCEKGYQYLERWGEHWVVQIDVAYVQYLIAVQKTQVAFELLQRMSHMRKSVRLAPEWQVDIAGAELSYYMDCGKLPSIQAWLQRESIDFTQFGIRVEAIYQLYHIRAQVALGYFQRAIDNAQILLNALQETNLGFIHCLVSIECILAYWHSGQPQQATKMLSSIADVVESELYIAPWLVHRTLSFAFFTDTAVQKHLSDHAVWQRILTLCKQKVSGADMTEGDEIPLQAHQLGITRKEWQVWCLIAAEQRNEQISEQLYVALSTVKSHIRSLYKKLGVANRKQAKVRFIEMNQSVEL